MKAKEFVDILDKNGAGPFLGVPCSILKPIINYIELENYDYINTSSEGEAIGVAAGLSLCGKIPVVMMQNSGLGNTVNPITSLIEVYKLKSLLCITLRGAVGEKDEPQHKIMGQITEGLLKTLDIKYEYIYDHNCEKVIHNMISYIDENNSCGAIIIKKGFFEDDYKSSIENSSYEISRSDVIHEVLNNIEKNAAIISTTGKISRELWFYNKNNGIDDKNCFYMFGSMGCADAIGLGVAWAQKNRSVVVLDGDGAVLMKMGNLSTIGSSQVKKYLHIVIDNECYNSTGGQASNSRTTHIHEVAKSCGYNRVYKVNNKEELINVLVNEINKDGIVMILIKTCNIQENSLSRPDETPEHIKEEFYDFLNS